MTQPAYDSAPQSDLASVLARLAGAIGAPHFPGSDRAALRRWMPGQPIPLAFYRLWLKYLGGDLPPEGQTEAWMAIAWGMATLGANGRAPAHPLGQALAQSGYHEARLERLLSAPEAARLALFMSAVRFLAAKGKRPDWREAAQFLLTRDAGKRESLHRRIAQTYYGHQP